MGGLDLRAGGEPFGGYPYPAAAYVLAPQDLTPLAEELHENIGGIPRALASASAPTPRVCAARILAHDATSLYRALNSLRTTARAFLDLPPAAREVR